jgi:uncharacterized protein YcaQ
MALFAEGTYDGPPRLMSTPRRRRPDRDQLRAQRNALWLEAIESGLPGFGPTVSVADLAGMFKLSPQTVLNGLAAARADRAAIASVSAA